MPLTLLNVDLDVPQERISDEIWDHLEDVKGFLQRLSGENLPDSRKVVLRNKLKELQNLLSIYLEAPRIPSREKHEFLMKLHPDLIGLANMLLGNDTRADRLLLTCIDLVLHHLCSTAASSPREMVIGVSNVLAQVLMMKEDEDTIPEIEPGLSVSQYYDQFQEVYNYLITHAGLFTSAVTGLPGISISALGSWASKALSGLAKVQRFIDDSFDPIMFYAYNVEQHPDNPFDTIADVLNFQLFMNEFLSTLASRADVLSGLELPKEISPTEEKVTFQSTTQITSLLCDQIHKNSERAAIIVSRLTNAYQNGQINKNDNPREDPVIQRILLIADTWRLVADFGKIMAKYFETAEHCQEQGIELNLETLQIDQGLYLKQVNTDLEEEYLSLATQSTLEHNLLKFVLLLHKNLEKLKRRYSLDEEEFYQTTAFYHFREFFKFLVMGVAFHDLIFAKSVWLPWLLEEYHEVFSNKAIPWNPRNVLLFGVFEAFWGMLHDVSKIVHQSISFLDQVSPYFEFEAHHMTAIRIITKLCSIYLEHGEFLEHVKEIETMTQRIIEEYSIQENSVLHERIALYVGMLEIMKETGIFLRRQREREVPFDPFSWIKMPKDSSVNVPYIPLNTALDNLVFG